MGVERRLPHVDHYMSTPKLVEISVRAAGAEIRRAVLSQLLLM